MTDNLDARQRAFWRAWDRSNMAQRRKWMRMQLADALRVARIMKAAGFPMRSATIMGVAYEFGEPVKASDAKAPADEVEAWIAKQKARADAR